MRPVFKRGTMNRTENEFAQILEVQKRSGEIVDYQFEPLKFRLADKTYYSPDFLIVHRDCFEIVEIKGFLRDDANVKFKATAEKFPWFKWTMLKKENGKWTTIRSISNG